MCGMCDVCVLVWCLLCVKVRWECSVVVCVYGAMQVWHVYCMLCGVCGGVCGGEVGLCCGMCLWYNACAVCVLYVCVCDVCGGVRVCGGEVGV